MEDLKNQIEALLFASGKFMSDENLSLIVGQELKEVRKAIKDLTKDYEERDHSLRITTDSNTWKINVREKYLDLVRKIVADTELPKTVLETLAVIAWKSPSLQSEIIKTRGNKAYEHIALLEEMEFVKKNPEGRSYIIKVTEKFFDYFDVEGDKSLKDMFKEVKIPEKPEDDPQETLIKDENKEQSEDSLENTDTEKEGDDLGNKLQELTEKQEEIEEELEKKEEDLEEQAEEKELEKEFSEDVLEEEANLGKPTEGEPLNETETEVLQETEEEVNDELSKKTKAKK